MYIDTHTHLTYADKYDDVEQIATNLQREGIQKIINIGCTIDSSKMAIAQAKKYNGIYAACGIHPSYVDTLAKDNLLTLERLCKEDKVVALGECGLDYHYPNYDKKQQQEIFLQQLELAFSLNLPIIIHARDCHEDMIPLLKSNQQLLKNSGVMHCFAGSLAEAEAYLSLGLYISFSGTVTFKSAKSLQQVAASLPQDKLLAETDCPYLAPEPVRGTVNTPFNVKYVYHKLATLRDCSIEKLQEDIWQNAHTLFKKLNTEKQKGAI